MLLLCSIHQEIWLKGQNGKQPCTLMKEQHNNKKIQLQKYILDEQEDSLQQLQILGDMLGVKSVPIEFGVDGKHRRLKLKDTLESDVLKVGIKIENRFYLMHLLHLFQVLIWLLHVQPNTTITTMA